MNRHAAVLAADSATTVSQWNGRNREVRYFKGANKINALSDHAPVGVMIFDGADILSVPWEVVIKSFRQYLGTKTFNSINGYAEELFSYLEGQVQYFPLDIQKQKFFDAAKRAALRLGIEVRDRAGESSGPADWTVLFDKRIVELSLELEKKPLSPLLKEDWIKENVLTWVPELSKIIDAYFNVVEEEPRPSDFDKLSTLVIWRILKDSGEYLGCTGIVIAGYGDHDIFPSYVEYASCGLVAGKHLVREVAKQAIDHDTPADLSAFAQTGMIDTFQLGLDSSVFVDANGHFASAAHGFAEELTKACGANLEAVPGLADLISNARTKFSEGWIEETRQKHALPLRRVLAALPIREMAELAETLVNLQSLKEKVTKPSEEVGGPIDVAVITKAEGLVWVRRKHYFDPSLNARYMARLGGIYQ